MTELYHWPAEVKWGLPSFDIPSLHVMAFIKFTGADVTFIPTKRSWLSKKGHTLPCLYTASQDQLEGTHEILQYLRLKYYNPNTWMPREVKENVLPITSLIEDKLLPAVQAAFWLDNRNYTEITRGIYAKACQYPLNFSVPQKIHQQHEEFVKISKRLSEEEMMIVVEKLHGDAASTLNLLSEYLGDKDYLFGSKPSSVDALLFSGLAPLLKIPLLSSKLQNHLKACTNLCQYVARILQFHFKADLASKVSAEEVKCHDDEEWNYDWILPVVVATVAMVSYAVNAGLLQKTRV